ncbi:hypothetical protein NDU88_007327 [Pleurodeles waltl]|uniref:Uncharacterized protein n=1 Tax=Pleurodeles waltl TaxID=8319 RepID=A0AAV7PLI1_PLEWA|nr:hypothetical protein NDU88_007327 [Pleurodeles waltl]
MRVTGSNQLSRRRRELGAREVSGWRRKQPRRSPLKPEPSTKSLLLRQFPQCSASRPKIGPRLHKASKAPNG